MRQYLVSLVSSALIAAAVVTPAVAQETATREMDWNLTEVPERKALIAIADFDVGLSFATRCMDGVFDVTIHGLPEARGMTRTLGITINDEDPYESSWIVATQKTTAFSRVPVRFARDLAKGGTLQIRVAGERNKPGTRYVIDLPPSVSAVEQTLTACSKSLVDLRYDTMLDENLSGLPQGLEWKDRPRFNFPRPVGRMMSTVGYVSVSCGVSPELRPTDCQIESEFPPNFNFGREVLRKVSSGQLQLTGENPTLVPQATILFNVNFMMQ